MHAAARVVLSSQAEFVVLARANRLRNAADFRLILRTGRKVSCSFGTVSLRETTSTSTARFGFVISRKVGNAVMRNKLRRQLRAISRETVDSGLMGIDVVIRALPGACDQSWNLISSELKIVLRSRDASWSS